MQAEYHWRCDRLQSAGRVRQVDVDFSQELLLLRQNRTLELRPCQHLSVTANTGFVSVEVFHRVTLQFFMLA